jgi:heme exporter protein B
VSFVRQVSTVAGKDLRVELRSREVVYTMVFFGAMVMLIFSFAFVEGRTARTVGEVSSGILWISILFSGTLGLSRAFDREREGNTMRGLLLAPVPRSAIFLGKAIGIGVFMLVTAAVVTPMIALLFNAPVFRYPVALALTLTLAIAGFAIVGSVFASMLLRSQARAVLLPVVLYPIVVPLMIAATKATAGLIGSTPEPEAAYFWIKFLGIFDATFLLGSLWLFESLVIE